MKLKSIIFIMGLYVPQLGRAAEIAQISCTVRSQECQEFVCQQLLEQQEQPPEVTRTLLALDLNWPASMTQQFEARAGEKIVGYLLLRPYVYETEIRFLVAEKGAGQDEIKARLLLAAARSPENRKIHSFDTRVLSSDAVAQASYQALGFALSGCPETVVASRIRWAYRKNGLAVSSRAKRYALRGGDDEWSVPKSVLIKKAQLRAYTSACSLSKRGGEEVDGEKLTEIGWPKQRKRCMLTCQK